MQAVEMTNPSAGRHAAVALPGAARRAAWCRRCGFPTYTASVPEQMEAGHHVVDRDVERAVIEELLHDAVAGRGQSLVIRGPAGIGKTTLLRLLEERGTGLGMRILRTRGDPLEGDFPWNGVRRLFERMAGERGAGGVMPRDAGVLDPAPRDGASLMSALHHLYWRCVELAEDRPLILAIDDAHWLDELSLRWLAYMMSRIEDEPILLAAAVRGGGLALAEDSWSAVLSRSAILDVGPLAETDSGRLLARALGREPDPSFTAECQREAAGNPFLLTELAGIARALGVSPDQNGVDALSGLKREISPSISLRLKRLGPDCHAAAGALALLGRQATLGRVGSLCGFERARTAGAFERLIDDGLVRAEPELGFVHPLVRTAAYEDLDAPLRGTLHLAAARLLYDAGCDSDLWASQLLRATPFGDQWVVERLREAARYAEERAAPGVAATYLRRALEEPPVRDQRCDTLLQLGRSESSTAPGAAEDRYREALEQASDPRQATEARIGLAHTLSFDGRFAEAAEVLERGLAAVPASDAERRDELLAALLNAARWDVDVRTRCRTHFQVIKTRSDAGEKLTPRLRANLALELLAEGRDRNRTISEARAAIEALEGTGLEGVMWIPLLWTPLACAGELNRSIRDYEPVLELVRDRGWTAVLSVALSANAKFKIWRGDITSAVVDAEEAVACAEDPISLCYAVTFLAEAYRLRGESGPAWDLLESHRYMGRLLPVWPFPQLQAERGWLRYEHCGDIRGALDDLYAHGEWAERYGLRCPAVVPWRSRAAFLVGALGDVERARKLAEAELQDARAWGERRTLGTALRGLALVLDGDAQLRLLQEAEAVLAGSESSLAYIDTLVDLGAALRRRGHRVEAREPLRRAAQLATEAGAFAVGRRAQEELTASGARPRRIAVRGRDALTPSELRVATLAGAGRSNPEIAKLLFVTRRTVETHLTSVYGKLGIGRREELLAALESEVS